MFILTLNFDIKIISDIYLFFLSHKIKKRKINLKEQMLFFLFIFFISCRMKG